MNTIIGMFDDPAAARRAVDTLRDSPLALDDVSIISRDTRTTGHSSEDVTAGQGATVGAVWGGLVGLAALLIPGVGPFIAFGALGAALTGAVTGAVVGGITAALVDFSGIPETEARAYEDQIQAGKTLVAVRARDEDSLEVHRLLSQAGAGEVQDEVLEVGATRAPSRVAMYDERGQRVEEDLDADPYIHGSMIEDTPAAPGLTNDLPLGVRGVYDVPPGADTIPNSERESMDTQRAEPAGEAIGEPKDNAPIRR